MSSESLGGSGWRDLARNLLPLHRSRLPGCQRMPSKPSRLLEDLYLSCQSELQAALYARVRCRDTADDLCQEAFARLCRAEDLSDVGNLKAYLFRTAQNLLFDHYRGKAVRDAATVEWSEDTPLEAEDWRCAETVALSEQELDRLIAGLADLSPLCQRMFYLSQLAGQRISGLFRLDALDQAVNHLQIAVPSLRVTRITPYLTLLR